MTVKMMVSTQNLLEWSFQMERFSVLMDGGHRWREQTWEGMKVCSRSYAVRSVPGAGLAVLGAVRGGGQAAAGVRVVGGQVRGALWWVVVLGEGRAGGHAVAFLERTEWQQRHCLLTVNTAGLIPRKSYGVTGLCLWSWVASRLCLSVCLSELFH